MLSLILTAFWLTKKPYAHGAEKKKSISESAKTMAYPCWVPQPVVSIKLWASSISLIVWLSIPGFMLKKTFMTKSKG